MKKLRVTVEGKTYEVLVEVLEDNSGASALPARPPATASIAPRIVTPVVAAPAPATAAPAASGGPGDVASPLAGKVVSIDVKIGDAVAEGGQVATVEAMKMNTYIYAHKAGNIAAIHVNAGDGVEEGGVLLSIA